MLYFFNLSNGSEQLDSDGIDLPNIHAARIEGIKYFSESLKENADVIEGDCDWQLTVCNERGSILLTFIFMLSVAPALRPTELTFVPSADAQLVDKQSW